MTPGPASGIPAKIALGLIGLAWVLPFFSPNFFEPISSFYGEVIAFALGLLAVSMLVFRPLWAGLRLPRTGLLFLMLAGAVLLHAALGKTAYPQISLLAALYLLWAAALAVLTPRLKELIGPEGMAKTLSWFLLAGALASSVIGLIQFYGVGTPISPLILPQVHGRIYANTGQPNHLASYLSLGLVSAGYLWSTRRLPTVAAVAAVLVLLPVLSASGSRSAWGYLLMLVVLSVAFARPLRDSDAGRRLLIFSVVVAAGFAVAQFAPDFIRTESGTTAQSVAERMRAIEADAPLRLRHWRKAWLMFSSAPLMGVGFGNFAWNSFLLNAQLPATGMEQVISHHAHNLVMHTAAELGIAGLAILLGGLGLWLRGLRGQRGSPQLWWAFGILGILGIHSMLEYPLWYAYFLGIAAVALASSESMATTAGGLRTGRPVLLLVLLLGWVSLANVYRDYRTMQLLQSARAHSSARQSEGGDTKGLLDLRRRSLFTPYIELALSRRMVLNRERLADKIALNGYVMRLFPDSDVVYRHAILLAMSGERDAARLQWDRAAASFPGSRQDAVRAVEALAGEPGMSGLLNYVQANVMKESK